MVRRRTENTSDSGGGVIAVESTITLTVSITPASANFSSTAASGFFALTVNDSTRQWTAQSSQPGWLHTSSSGTGSGSISYTVDANTSSAQRTGNIAVLGQTFLITQAAYQAQGCALSQASTTVASLGVTASLSATCNGSWTVTSSQGWLTVNPTTGSGNATLSYTVSANTGASRSATLTVGGATFSVSQDGAPAACTTIALNPTTASIPGTAGGGQSVGVSTPCGAWTAVSDSSWLRVTSGASGSGSGNFVYAWDANTNTVLRSATITVSGAAFSASFSVSQSGIETYELSPNWVQLFLNRFPNVHPLQGHRRQSNCYHKRSELVYARVRNTDERCLHSSVFTAQ